MPLDPHAAVSPVDWVEWGPAAFERAKREDKPILLRVHQAWTGQRDQLAAEVERIRARRRERPAPAPAGELDGSAIARIVEAALDAYDWRYGGFGTQPKFPQPETVRLLLHAWSGSGADAPREAAENTLVAMQTAGLAEGRTYGLYDHA